MKIHRQSLRESIERTFEHIESKYTTEVVKSICMENE